MQITCSVIRFAAASLMVCVSATATSFYQTNIVSSIPGLAAVTDPNLKNPWGVSFSNTSPFWVSNQVTNTTTIYTDTGSSPLAAVSIPTTAGGPQGPTGQVFNASTAFEVAPGQPAFFLFSTLSGEIAGWNPNVSPTSAVAPFVATDGAVYTGLAIGSTGSANFLYAADFANGKIDVLNSSFQKTTLAGSFVDPNLPAGYVPYNIQNVDEQLFVSYSLVDPVTHTALEAPNQGIVSIFDKNGNFVQRLVTETNVSAPWGFAVAPDTWGSLAGALLVGNEGDGTISGFNRMTGAFIGRVSDSNGNPLVNEGLWGLAFRSETSGFDPNKLYFAAGIEEEEQGLFGSIQAVPEPGTFGLLTLAGLAGIRSLRKHYV
jgi:uncharacterized protein (TIGR03118 family)